MRQHTPALLGGRGGGVRVGRGLQLGERAELDALALDRRQRPPERLRGVPAVVDDHHRARPDSPLQVLRVDVPRHRGHVVRVAVGYDCGVSLLARPLQHVRVPHGRGGPEPAPGATAPCLLAAGELRQQPVAVQEGLVEGGGLHGDGRPVELEVVAELVALLHRSPQELPAALAGLGLHASLLGVRVKARHDEERGGDLVLQQDVQDLLQGGRLVQQRDVVDGQRRTPPARGDAPDDVRGEALQVRQGPVGLQVDQRRQQHGDQRDGQVVEDVPRGECPGEKSGRPNGGAHAAAEQPGRGRRLRR
mmetsp:Transcript_8602/g.26128  ORF Transcript_8602/g.26128 Transcript_8602/m.26128 type:complete len:305 (-) Transcript_8602:33-947(-)